MPEAVGMKVGKSGSKAANQTLSKTPFSCTTQRNLRQRGTSFYDTEFSDSRLLDFYDIHGRESLGL